MLYKDFGKTGKKVSAVGFGGMRFVADDYKKDIGLCSRLVREAHEKGITFFDTGPGYCDDMSEAIMGDAFKGMRYGDFYVSTKCGLWQATDAEGTLKMVEQSIKRLNVPRITFYNMWCIRKFEEYERMLSKGGMLDGMRRAKEAGMVEHICCTVHLKGDEIERIAKDGLVEGIILGYNAINSAYRRQGVKACADAGVGVVVMNPLGGGTIPKHPDKFAFLADGGSDSLAVAALKFLVAHDGISVTLPGISCSAEIDQAVSATADLPTVDEAYLKALEDRLGAELDTLCTCCAYCDECPAGLPVPKLVESYNEYILSGEAGMGAVKERLRVHWSVSADDAKGCTECGRCEELCTQKLPIIERLGFLADNAGRL